MPDRSNELDSLPPTLAFAGPAPKQAEPALKRLAQYRIVRQLGRGGMGVVYQAEDTQLNRMAALKVVRADYASDPEALARFVREAQAAARLKHDHIVTIYQVGEENGVPFLAMEFLSGKSLEEWLKPDRQATIVEVILISKQIARGLEAAHAAGLIHRDIKPANLWLEAPRGRLRILDFGLARHTSGDNPTLTQDGTVVGTPAFMAPEQARGDAVDARCDLFSLGCVMYRLLTGRLPFAGTTTFAVLTAIATQTPPSPIRIRSEAPQRLSDLVDRLLAKTPEQRPASAQAVLDELLAIEKQVKQPPSPPSLLTPQPIPAAVLLPTAATTVRAVPVEPAQETVKSAMPTLRVSKPARRRGNNRLGMYLTLGGIATLLVVVVVAASMNRTAREDPSQPKVAKRKEATQPTEVRPAKDAPAESTNPVTPQRPADEVARPSTPTVPERTDPTPAGPAVTPRPPVQPVATTSSPLVFLTELNSKMDDYSSWISPDALEIYFTRGDTWKGQQTYWATRRTTDERFGSPRLVNGLRHAVLSSDRLLMVGLRDDEGTERLFECRRANTTDEFSAPKRIEPFKNEPLPKSPWLANGGLQLIFQRVDNAGDYPGKGAQETEFVSSWRTSASDPWPKPKRMALSDSPLFSEPLTWPARSEDGLTLFFCHGGTRSPEIMYATRAATDKAFSNPQTVLVDGRPVRGRAPRYVAATQELYFSRVNENSGQSDFDLWKLTDFAPASAAPVAAKPPPKSNPWPKDAAAFRGHHFKFFAELTTWHEARDRCQAAGGYLVTIESAEENVFVAKLVEKAKWQESWIGISDEAKEGTWVTVRDKPMTYMNWFTGQPNNKLGGENFALMSGRVLPKESIGWRWCDQPDKALDPHRPGFVCEWEAASSEKTKEEFVSLFDGKSLAGWEGDKASFGAEKGVLAASGARGNLYTTEEFADFELRLDFRLYVGANSGIAIRTPKTGILTASNDGMELQVLDEANFNNIQLWQRHGSLYGVLSAKQGHLKPAGQWNRQTIRCQGDKLQVILNGTTILDANLDDLAKQQHPDGKPHPGLKSKRGHIVLMGQANRVELRNIEIKELQD